MNRPPQPPLCLTRSYASRGIRGGTVIAEEVLDLDTHREWLLDPDHYRQCVSPCLRCGHRSVHALCFRDRKPRPVDDNPTASTVAIRLYRCPVKDCGAVFTVLPAFIARHLWRTWSTVARAVGTQTGPESTLRRWLGRMRSDASQLIQRFHSLADEWTRDQLAADRPADRSAFLRCLETLLGFRHLWARVAGWIQRLEPGIRLM